MKINGVELYVEHLGAGKPLLFLHGNGEDESCFQNVVGELSKTFTCILVNSRGHGKSEMGSDVSLDIIIDDMAELIRALDIAGTGIVGFSDGANIAMGLAIKYPMLTGNLFLVGGNAQPSGVKFFYQAATVLMYIGLKTGGLFSKRLKKRAKIVRLMTFEPHFFKEQLCLIRSKAMVVAGSHDMIRESHTNDIAHCLKCEPVIIDGSHFLFNDAPEKLIVLINNFF